MASVGPVPCPYCQSSPCVGADCPSQWPDDFDPLAEPRSLDDDGDDFDDYCEEDDFEEEYNPHDDY